MSQQSSNGRLPAELLQQIASRLRPACPSIPDDEFARLVEEVARIKLKYDGDTVAGDVQRKAERQTG
jgi:hypothetical protein